MKHRVEFPMAKYPEHADALRHYADPDDSRDAFAVMHRSTWEAIQAGREPTVKPKRRKRTRQRIDPPGTWLANLIRVVTLGMVRPCTSCKSRARRLPPACLEASLADWRCTH